MSGEITIIPGKQFTPGELQTRAGLNQLGTPTGRVDEAAIGERELIPAAVRDIVGIVGKNLFTNGTFAYWPVNDTATGVVAGSRKHDYLGPARWVTANDTNRALSRQAHSPGQTDVPGAPLYFLRWVQSAPVDAAITTAYLGQRLENVGNYSGRTFTFTMWVKCNVTTGVVPSMRQMFGDAIGGSPSADVVVDKTAVVLEANTWTKIVATWTIPSVAGKSIVDGGGVANVDSFTEFRIVVPQGLVFTMDFSQGQLVEGDQEVIFDGRLPAADIVEAERYRQYIGFMLSDNLSTHGSPHANLRVKMRQQIATQNISIAFVSGTGGVVAADGFTKDALFQSVAHSAIINAKVTVDCELHAPA